MSRPAVWITAVTLLVVIAFVAVVVANGSGSGVGNGTTNNTVTTLINKPTLPGDDNSTESTLGGTTVRCKDGTYTFVSGTKTPDEDLCKNNGGVDERVP